MVTCSKCGHDNRDGAQICDICGTLLVSPSATRKYQDVDIEDGKQSIGQVRFRDELVLEVVDAGRQFVLSEQEIADVCLGRRDDDTGDRPHIDLTDCAAIEKGVSRRHAFIDKRDGILVLIDNNSANGTYLNGTRLVPLQPRILRDGDDIRLGYLTLRVTFRRQINSLN